MNFITLSCHNVLYPHAFYALHQSGYFVCRSQAHFVLNGCNSLDKILIWAYQLGGFMVSTVLCCYVVLLAEVPSTMWWSVWLFFFLFWNCELRASRCALSLLSSIMHVIITNTVIVSVLQHVSVLHCHLQGAVATFSLKTQTPYGTIKLWLYTIKVR
jgi:hypothetical protein